MRVGPGGYITPKRPFLIVTTETRSLNSGRLGEQGNVQPVVNTAMTVFTLVFIFCTGKIACWIRYLIDLLID